MWGEGASRREFEVSWKCVVYAIVVEVRGAYQGLKRRVYLSGELGSTVNLGLSWENSCFSTSRKCTERSCCWGPDPKKASSRLGWFQKRRRLFADPTGGTGRTNDLA